MIWGILIVLIVVCLGFLAWLFCIAPASPRGDFAEMKKYDYAHRGLHEKDLSVPENSMAGFKAAVEAGYGIEFDLQLTKDKKVVVHHDRSLKRVCGADVSIGDLTYKELQQYRLQNTEERRFSATCWRLWTAERRSSLNLSTTTMPICCARSCGSCCATIKARTA